MKIFREGKTGLWLAAIFAVMACLLALGGAAPQNTAASQEEKRIAEVLSVMAGVGKTEVALFYAPAEQGSFGTSTGVPTGAVVVAQGAQDVAVRLNLIRAVRTLLGLPESAVDVFVMEGET